MYSRKKYFYFFFLFSLFLACENAVTDQPGYSLTVPRGFPEPVIPKGSELTEARIALGKRLFYDPVLSGNNKMSCASCHKQEFAFADNKVKSTGTGGQSGKRNSPSLANVAYLTSFMRDGGVHTLELQAVVPVEDHLEMDLNINEAVKRLEKNPVYMWQSFKAYGRKPDHFVLTRALGAFQRTLISGNSKYDRSLYNGISLTAEEQRGKDLFFSDSLNCSSCHSGFLFTGQSFQNNGLYEIYEDHGRERITHKTEDLGKFRVTSLRNVGLTAPYMHDGSIATLEEVIEHYASGGKKNTDKSPLLKGFQLSEENKSALKQFLLALTDEDFIKNANFRY